MPTQLIEQTYDRWFWDERLSYQEPGDTSYATRRGNDGKKKKIYGKIFSIEKGDKTVTIQIERNIKSKVKQSNQ